MSIFKVISRISQLAGLRDDPIGVYERLRLTNPYGATAPAGTGVALNPLLWSSGKATNFILPPLGPYETNPIGVPIADIAANGAGEILFQGDAYVLLDASATAVIAGDALTVTTLGAWREPLGGERIFARAKESGTAGTLCRVSLDGFGGFGIQNAASVLFAGTIADTALTAGTVAAASIVEKTGTVAGLAAGMRVLVNPPAVPTPNGCQMVAARVAGANSLGISFANTQAAGALAIPAGNYTYVVFNA